MDMDMGMGTPSSDACKISMLWNWTTVNACFLSSTWHVRSKAQFAGSVLGVFFLVMAIEAVRRLGREYDRRLVGEDRARSADQGLRAKGSNSDEVTFEKAYVYTPTWIQHLLRSFIYGSQFTAAFLVMLLGMYYNGFILFAIFIGQTAGYFVFGRDTCGAGWEGAGGSGACC